MKLRVDLTIFTFSLFLFAAMHLHTLHHRMTAKFGVLLTMRLTHRKKAHLEKLMGTIPDTLLSTQVKHTRLGIFFPLFSLKLFFSCVILFFFIYFTFIMSANSFLLCHFVFLLFSPSFLSCMHSSHSLHGCMLLNVVMESSSLYPDTKR